MCLLLIISQHTHGQEVHSRFVEGTVVDPMGVALKGVTVTLVQNKDTVLTLTNPTGVYRFKSIKENYIKLNFGMLGKQDHSKLVILTDSSQIVHIPKVILFPGISNIDPVHILKTVPFYNKGDTTVFNMSAFSFLKNSLLEDVLKSSLPGFNVLRDGTTFYNGQVITSVQVDGRKFFGGDLLTATKNLPADYIKQIEVIDHYGDIAEVKGIKNNEPEKVINIVLHEDKKQILFGQATAGAGTSDRYLGIVGLNKFNRGQEVSVVASVNNTNTSLFAFGSPNGAGGRSTGISDIGDYADQSDGLNKTSSFGVTFTDNISSNTVLTGGYNYTQKENNTKGNSLLTSSYYGYRISQLDDYRTYTDDKTHKFNLELNTKFKNKDILRIAPTVTINRYIRDNTRDNTLSNYRLTNRGTFQDSSANDNPYGQIDVLYSKHFDKKGRKLVGDFTMNYNTLTKKEDVQESYVIFDTTSGRPMISTYDQQQLVNQHNETGSIRGSVSYVEPFYGHSLLEVSHEYDLTEIRMTRGVEASDAGQEIDSLGLNYEYLFNSNRTGLTYQYEPNNRLRANIGFAVQPLRLKGKMENDTLSYVYTNINLVPSAMIKYRFNDELDWQFNYNGRNSQPNFLHIAPIRDNTNSRNIIVGNPLLKAEFVNKLSTTLRKTIMSRSQYFELNLAYNFTNNKIVPAKSATSGETVQETTFTNTNGYYEMKGYYTFNTPLVNDNFNLDLSGNLDYFNNITFVNDVKNLTKQYLFSQNFQLRYNWQEYFETVFNTNYFLNYASFQLPKNSDISAQSVLFSLGGRGYLHDKLMFGAEMSQKFLRGYSADLTEVNPTILNTYIEYSFMKNRLALLRLQCFDLLDQNKNVGVVTEYVGNDIFESRNNRLGRYFMLTLNIRLQRSPKK